MARRDTLMTSLPSASSSDSSVIAGACRRSRSASNRRCSMEPPVDGSCVVQPTWFYELSKLVGDALSLHEENLASQSPDVRLSIGSDRPRHRETKSNDEFPSPHDLPLTLRRPNHTKVAASGCLPCDGLSLVRSITSSTEEERRAKSTRGAPSPGSINLLRPSLA